MRVQKNEEEPHTPSLADHDITDSIATVLSDVTYPIGSTAFKTGGSIYDMYVNASNVFLLSYTSTARAYKFDHAGNLQDSLSNSFCKFYMFQDTLYGVTTAYPNQIHRYDANFSAIDTFFMDSTVFAGGSIFTLCGHDKQMIPMTSSGDVKLVDYYGNNVSSLSSQPGVTSAISAGNNHIKYYNGEFLVSNEVDDRCIVLDSMIVQQATLNHSAPEFTSAHNSYNQIIKFGNLYGASNNNNAGDDLDLFDQSGAWVGWYETDDEMWSAWDYHEGTLYIIGIDGFTNERIFKKITF